MSVEDCDLDLDIEVQGDCEFETVSLKEPYINCDGLRIDKIRFVFLPYATDPEGWAKKQEHMNRSPVPTCSPINVTGNHGNGRPFGNNYLSVKAHRGFRIGRVIH